MPPFEVQHTARGYNIFSVCVCMLRVTGRCGEQLVAHSTGQQFLLGLFQCSFQSNDPFIT